MATEPFRTTPSLGPELSQAEAANYWDGVTDPAGDQGPSYPLGTRVTGNDGHVYIYVEAGANFAADARVDLNESTWAATANASGTHMAPVAVVSGEYFHARQFAL